MGQYINNDSKGQSIGASYDTKIHSLLADDAVVCSGNTYLPNMICVVDNGPFAAAAYCYSEAEYNKFARNDGRRKTWLIHSKAKELVK